MGFKTNKNTLSIFALAFAFTAQAAQAFHLGVVGGGVEEGDDRLRPYAGIEAGFWDEFINARIISYGIKFSIVKQETYIASLSVRPQIPVFSSKRFFATLGVWGLQETTTLEETENQYAKKEVLKSYGLLLGVRFKVIDSKYFYTALDWDGHIYFPGTASLYMATGRRQTLGCSIGVNF